MVSPHSALVRKPNFANPEVWPEVHAARLAEPPIDPLALARWIHLQTVTTGHMRALDEALARLRLRHLGHTERWLAVSGESDLGKSQAITTLMLREAMSSPEPWFARRRDGSLHVPFVYVELEGNEEAPGLMSAIARF